MHLVGHTTWTPVKNSLTFPSTITALPSAATLSCRVQVYELHATSSTQKTRLKTI